ncbi:single-stranded-DNA-specific exonuclease RecJ [Thermotoga sp. KOL6]|uniref:single-stranded-DNA-specific exonuclease RecJ n=1 Tax=Thermotoga sp. KOL6 TaxID=126741 RepID=UPI000C761B45|nr:single-stranded-DNA-specific exonuclease RecJ [Thermotoga sp. KOL6]PLV60347.1 single-stranded-DNA-specific exonuclease RecJ [Thermotoga sp. KOL6]
MKKWELSQPNEGAVKRISQHFGLTEIAARILVNRGIDTEEAVESFLFIDESHQHDPFLFKDMEKAVEILLKARAEKSRVLIHGDYDVDGITSAAILKEFLEENGWLVDVYIPHRIEEGYGVQPENITAFREENVSYLVTVDCGITAFESIALAKDLGMKVIVTDHHEVNNEVPPADAVVNPKVPGEKYPFRDLAGVGVTYKLVQALARVIKYSGVEKFLELVALGTVADMVSLLDENRYFVKKGIELLKETRRIGLRKLLERLGLKGLTSHDISYKVAPRLNAAGRMGSAIDAFKLLTMTDPIRANDVVDRLMELNNIRRKTEREIYREAVEIIEANDLWKEPIIVVAKENWHLGVIGIVAAKLANRYEKPVAVVSLSDEFAKGSIRSYNGYDIMSVFSDQTLEIFDEIGGHASAAGFTLRREQLNVFREHVKNLVLEEREEKVIVDAEIKIEDINGQFVNDIGRLMPFGQGNPEPVLLFSDLIIEKIHFFGEENSNVILHLRNGEKKLEIVGYGFKNLADSFSTLPVCPTKGNVVVNVRPMGGSLHYYLVSLEVKPSFHVKNKAVENILRGSRKRTVVKVPYPSKTKFLLSVKEEVGGRLAVVSLTNAAAQNVSGCLTRYSTTKLPGFVNSTLSKNRESEIVVLTLMGFLKHLPLDDFNLFVISEFQDFVSFARNEQVQRFLDIVERYPEKFVLISSMNTLELETFLKGTGYEALEFRTDELEEFFISDQRGSFSLESLKEYSGFSVVVSEKKLVPVVYSKLGRNVLVYYGGMDLEKKMKVIGMIENGSVQKAILTSNSDGLPTYIKGDIFFYDFPLSIYEVIDLLRKGAVINLCYSNQSIEKRRDELSKLFPSRDKLMEIILSVKNIKELEEFLENSGIKGRVLKGIYEKLLEDMGLDLKTWSYKGSDNVPWRVIEGEIEKTMFENTVRILTKDLKELFSFFKSKVVR